MEVRPFTDKQIALLKTFADQAVIAIENVRLFKELQERNRQLTESLEQQTATSEVLKVISRSTFDLQPVLQTLVENAARLCRADTGFILKVDGEVHRWAADFGASAEWRQHVEKNPIPRGRASLTGRVEIERRPVHVLDVLADPDYQLSEHQRIGGYRTMLGVPMLREGTLVGVFFLSRSQVEAFTDKQIELVTTFADQAVIAIENTRLLQELQTRNRDLSEALEQQTATSEILRVISSSPTDLQPVMNAVAESAARLCDSIDAQIYRVDGNVMRRVASHGSVPVPPPLADVMESITRGWVPGRAVVDRHTIHVHDIQAAEAKAEYPLGQVYVERVGTRTILATPLLREGVPIGAFSFADWKFGRFLISKSHCSKPSPTRLSLRSRTCGCLKNSKYATEISPKPSSRRQQRARWLRVIASSPTDLQPVLDTVIANARNVTQAKQGHMVSLMVSYSETVCPLNETAANCSPNGKSYPISYQSTVRAVPILEGRPVHTLDAQADTKGHASVTRDLARGQLLIVPLLRERTAIGSITDLARRR